MSAFVRFIGLTIVLALAAFLVHTSSENPGTFHFVGFGWDVTMSGTFAVLLFAIAIILTYFFGQMINYIMNTPTRLRQRRGLKKAKGGLDLLHQGFLALSAGDKKTAYKHANQAAKKLPNTALADVLAAQASDAEPELHALTNKPASALVGHLGLMERAAEDDQWSQAIYHADKALSLHKNSPKAKAVLLEAYLQQKEWDKAASYTDDAQICASLALLEAIKRRDDAPKDAQQVALQGLKKYPAFIPLVMFAAALHSAAGEHKQAEKLLSSTFTAQPRLDLFARLMDTASVVQPNGIKRAKKLNTLLGKLDSAQAQIQHLCRGDVALDSSNTKAAQTAFNTARNHGEVRELCQRFAKVEKLNNNPTEHADWLQKALLAPALLQAGDADVQFWQAFKAKYADQPVLGLAATDAPKVLLG